MKVRPIVLFDSDLPYDGIEEGSDFIQWPGKNVAEALAEILVNYGYTDVAIDNLEHAGYDIAFNAGKRQLGARVSFIDTYTVSLYQYSWLDGLFRRLRPEYIETLKRVNAALANDGRFHNIRWFADEELFIDIQGAASPIEE